MSVFERAVGKLKGSGPSRPPRESIARVSGFVDGSSSRASPLGGINPTRNLEFDLEALRKAGLYATGNQRLAEEYRIIKRPLLKTAAAGSEVGQERANLLMIASALPGEGKTFTSVNLSMSVASEKDWDVLLVDVDCRNPQLSGLLGVRSESGLLDLLRDPQLTLDDLVFGTNVDKLYVLPVGTPGEDAAELLGSARMAELCDVLSVERHRCVIFDSSPLLLTTEPVVLSGQVGQAVIVVHAHKTPRQAVKEAVDKLDTSLAIGFVLNRMSREDEGLRYGAYGYGRYPYTSPT